jgi:hypothetical protein
LVSAAGFGLLVLAGVFVVVDHASGSGQEVSPLRTVSAALLEGSRLSLTKTDTATQSRFESGRASAEAKALAGQSGANVAESALMVVVDQLSDPPARCLCWVIVVDSTDPVFVGQPRGSKTAFVSDSTFRLALIDAATGEYLYGVEGAHGRTTGD